MSSTGPSLGQVSDQKGVTLVRDCLGILTDLGSELQTAGEVGGFCYSLLVEFLRLVAHLPMLSPSPLGTSHEKSSRSIPTGVSSKAMLQARRFQRWTTLPGGASMFLTIGASKGRSLKPTRRVAQVAFSLRESDGIESRSCFRQMTARDAPQLNSMA